MRLKVLAIASALLTAVLAPIHSSAAVTPPIKSDTHFEGDTQGPYTSIYMDQFFAKAKVNFIISAGSTLIVDSTTASSQAVIDGTNLSFTLPAALDTAELNKVYVTYHSASDNRDYWIYLNPPALHPYGFDGDTSALDSKTMLYTPGTFVIAQKQNNILFFERTPDATYAFQKLRAPAKVSKGTATYAYLVKTDSTRKTSEPGYWIYLDANFRAIDSTTSFTIGGAKMQPEGHDITVSAAGNPVMMSYFPRTVKSDWLATPYTPQIFDCVIAEIGKDGKPVHAFSTWDYVNGNKKAWKPILDKSETATDTSANYSATDWCHINSINYDVKSSQYIVSYRSLDRVFLISNDFKKVNAILTAPGARQHYARMINPTTVTALGNYTSGTASKLLTWIFAKKKWTLKTDLLPLHMSYCGNINKLTATTYFVAGGCGTATPQVFGYVVSTTTSPWSLIGTVKSAHIPPYRIELTN